MRRLLIAWALGASVGALGAAACAGQRVRSLEVEIAGVRAKLEWAMPPSAPACEPYCDVVAAKDPESPVDASEGTGVP